jgi:hypothetical protein
MQAFTLEVIRVFDKRFRPSTYKRKSGEYNLSLPSTAEWSDKPQRVMLVLETIDSQDLKESTLLFERSKVVLNNLLLYTIKQARSTFEFDRRTVGFCAVNFNNEKFMDKPKETWGSYRQQFMGRLTKIVQEMEPTHIIVFGDRAAHSILPEIDFLEKKRGWVFDTKIGGVKVKVCPTLDLQPLYVPKKTEVAGGAEDEDDDDDEGGDDKDVYGKANLLFYVSQNVMNGLAGRNLYDLSHVKAKPIYIDSMVKFKKLWKKLIEAEAVAVDTEGRNLTVNHNAVHTIQFAFGTKRGYMLPFNDPETPWDKEELAYITAKMRKFFGARQGKLPLKYLIFQYGMFDLRTLRVELGLPIIHHDVWEISAGEYCFHPDTLIETETGLRRIIDVVEDDVPTKVWSFNREAGVPELKEVINKFEIVTPEAMLEIEHEYGSFKVTENHKVWSVTRSCYVLAKDIMPGEQLQILHAPACGS